MESSSDVIQSFTAVIDAWPRPSVPTLAEDIAAPAETVKKWHQRGRIPSFWWPKVLEAAQRRDIDITLEQLAALDAQRRQTA